MKSNGSIFSGKARRSNPQIHLPLNTSDQSTKILSVISKPKESDMFRSRKFIRLALLMILILSLTSGVTAQNDKDKGTKVY